MTKISLGRVSLGLFLCLCAAFLMFSVQRGSWLQTDLIALLPEQNRQTALQAAADRIQEQRLNRQLVALVALPEGARAFSLAGQIAEQWRQSGLFRQVNAQMNPDIKALAEEIRLLAFAVLPQHIRTQLLENAQSYFQQYAQQLVNPFAAYALLTPDQDWLGFGRFTPARSQHSGNMQWDGGSGMLYRQQQGMTWVLIYGVLHQERLIGGQDALLNLMEQSASQARAQGGEFSATGTALFAASAKQRAERESLFMSLCGLGLILLLLFALFRTLRVFWLFLPIAAGMLAGIAATVLFFGHIHLLTLVVGTSLIGVLLDFPLHWLASSLFRRRWRPAAAMEELRLTFLLSLMITLLGYLLLGFTPLPVLTQTALFSAAALLTAIMTTLLFLPLGFKNYRTKPLSYRIFRPIPALNMAKGVKRAVVFGLIFFIGGGLYKSQWQDDIRQWVAMPPELLRQAQQIAALTGTDLSSQYLLLVAGDEDSLLNKSEEISRQLESLRQQGKLQEFQSLSQWILSESAQRDLAVRLKQHILPADYAALAQIGLEAEKIDRALAELAERPPLALSKALDTRLGQAWANLYLGELRPGYIGAVIKVSGIQDMTSVRQLANRKDIFWQDKPSELNQAFQQTRDQAAWLKLISFALAALLLWKLFGGEKTLQMLLIPLFSIVATIALFGWLGLPISLFAMFGLLLVSAISIDYTAYMQTVRAPLAAKRTAVSLASLTTMLSFVLLGFSSTPAVAAFGLSVSIGVGISLLATLKFLR
ncbi:MMPL family transporter [Mesocricetibacter intestinalis]|uniref:MMPL family transporter n=1 Tax=Mesocricetibacter intestinalis TaxID=1521930 RepID=UPI003C7B43C9